MPADSELKEGSCHSLNWVTAGKANKEGGVKWVSSPMSRWRTEGLLLRHKNASTYREEPTPTIGDGSKSPKTAEQTILNMEPR